MSKGTITAEIGEGQYTVTLNPDNSCIDSELTRLAVKQTDIEAEITEKETEVSGLLALFDTAKTTLNVTISQFIAGTATEAQVTEAEKAARSARLDYEKGKAELATLKAEVVKVRTDIIRLTNAKLESESRSVWCADKTTGATGEVGLLDLPGGSVLIKPSAPAYAYASDGVFVSPESVGQATNYLFWALHPCVDKFKPLYRVGVISNIDTGGDTADVTLDVTLGDQNLDINVTRSLTGIDVVYMTCNASAFTEGDRVVVKQIGGTSTVVGFESEPKGCDVWSLNGYVRNNGGVSQWVSGVFSALGDRPIADSSAFRVTIDGFDVPFDSESGSAGNYDLYFVYNDGSQDLADCEIRRHPTLTCDGEPMIWFRRRKGISETLPTTLTVRLEENNGSEWVDIINCSIETNQQSGSLPTYTYFVCEDLYYNGDAWEFTPATGTSVENRNPDTVNWLTIL